MLLLLLLLLCFRNLVCVLSSLIRFGVCSVLPSYPVIFVVVSTPASCFDRNLSLLVIVLLCVAQQKLRVLVLCIEFLLLVALAVSLHTRFACPIVIIHVEKTVVRAATLVKHRVLLTGHEAGW